MSMKLVREIQKSDKLAAFDREIPGKSCGNKECENLCAEVCKIAKNLGMAPKEMICDALEKEIVPKFKCKKVEQFTDYPNKGKPIPGCRFGYTYGNHPDKTDAQLEKEKNGIPNQYDRSHSVLRQGKGHTIQFHVKGSPGKPGFLGGSTSFDGIDDLLNQLEKKYPLHSIEHLTITNHSGAGGSFPTNEKGDEQIQNLQHKWNNKLLGRLKQMLSKTATLELRMCRGGEGEIGAATAQDIANTVGCRVIVYENKVNSAGGKAPYTFLLPGKKEYFPKVENRH